MGGYDYGYPPPPYYPAPPMPMPDDTYYYPEEPHPSDSDLYPSDDEHSGYEPVEEENFDEKEWDKVVQKCKVINVDDSTVIIKNCTTGDLVENPYASSGVGDKNNKKDHLNEEYYRLDPPEPYYQPNAYNPYAYYPAPAPPVAPYYGAPYYPAPYYPRPMPQLRNIRQDGLIRPYPIDNFGSDGEDYGEPDDIWENDEEADLLEKGFQRSPTKWEFY